VVPHLRPGPAAGPAAGPAIPAAEIALPTPAAEIALYRHLQNYRLSAGFVLKAFGVLSSHRNDAIMMKGPKGWRKGSKFEAF